MRKLLPIFCALAVTLLLLPSSTLAGPTSWEQHQDDVAYQDEAQFLLSSGREAAALAAIAREIEPIVAERYGQTVRYYLTSESDPNAYSYYAGRVYVSKGMVDFADNREMLAGVMCHESSHILHHDGLRDKVQSDRVASHAQALSNRFKILHRHGQGIVNFVVHLETFHYSRGQEEDADLTGADICSEAHFNPYGIAWMLEKVNRVYGRRSHKLWFLQDHPTNGSRVAKLRRYIRTDPTYEMRAWRDTPGRGTPLGP